ncbi:hypothetical protein [Aureimonas endophytica]|uniref:hypothetical protein n=1 Tax=Aureimonas endophytica TaxID=2027858 RepID=UPI00166BED31|nr:hypothetical protein [Aureimonas endophytica]
MGSDLGRMVPKRSAAMAGIETRDHERGWKAGNPLKKRSAIEAGCARRREISGWHRTAYSREIGFAQGGPSRRAVRSPIAATKTAGCGRQPAVSMEE